jgi:DnaK suppressor protein
MTPRSPRAPASALLSAEALSRLESLLLSELAAQTERIEECRATLLEVADQIGADGAFEREVAEVGLAQADAAIRDVRHALGRLELGTYGTCEGCGREIPFERLEVIAQARRCVACPTERTGLLG